jgi:hypothetical protein
MLISLAAAVCLSGQMASTKSDVSGTKSAKVEIEDKKQEELVGESEVVEAPKVQGAAKKVLYGQTPVEGERKGAAKRAMEEG